MLPLLWFLKEKLSMKKYLPKACYKYPVSQRKTIYEQIFTKSMHMYPLGKGSPHILKGGTVIEDVVSHALVVNDLVLCCFMVSGTCTDELCSRFV